MGGKDCWGLRDLPCLQGIMSAGGSDVRAEYDDSQNDGAAFFLPQAGSRLTTVELVVLFPVCGWGGIVGRKGWSLRGGREIR